MLSLGEIARATGMTKSSAQRCAHTLEQLGYLTREKTRRHWILTPRILRLSTGYLAAHPLFEVVEPHLIELSLACGEIVSFAEPDGTDVARIASVASYRKGTAQAPSHQRLPMLRSAAGYAYMLALPAGEAQRLLWQLSLQSSKREPGPDPLAVVTLLRRAREAGYAWHEARERKELAIAAPVLDLSGRPVAVIDISADGGRWTLEELRWRFSALLLGTARAASRAQGTRLRA